MENNSTTESSVSTGKMIVVLLWLASLAAASIFSYSLGKNTPKEKEVIVQNNLLTPTASQINSNAPTSTSNICKSSGLAQKWEYLTSYTVKEGDDLKSVVEKELGDSSRLNEVIQLNAGGSYQVAGATLYLPPKDIPKSSGNLKQVSGMLLDRNNSNWHLGFGSDAEGPGIMIPTYWFTEVTNKSEFANGDCITVLFDDGFKVFSVKKQ